MHRYIRTYVYIYVCTIGQLAELDEKVDLQWKTGFLSSCK